MLVGERELLSDTDLESHVRGAELTRLRAGQADGFRIWIDSDDLRRIRRATKCHAPIATAHIDHALATDQAEAAVFSEFICGQRSQ